MAYMTVREYNPCEGDYVKWNRVLEGMVGEVYPNDKFYIWHNNTRFSGSTGTKSPHSKGYVYSCSDGRESIEIIKKGGERDKNMLMRIPTTLKRVLDKDLRKQYKANLIDGELALTEEGKKEAWAIIQNMEEVKKGLSEKADEIIKEAKEER